VEPAPQREEALAVATRALARREHSRRSLRERLLRARVGAGEADEVVEELLRLGLLDDGRFARERARVLAERGKGDQAIRFDLRREGVQDPGDGASPREQRLRRGRRGSCRCARALMGVRMRGLHSTFCLHLACFRIGLNMTFDQTMTSAREGH